MHKSKMIGWPDELQVKVEMHSRKRHLSPRYGQNPEMVQKDGGRGEDKG